MIPRDSALDSTVTLLRDGYEFISNRAQELDSDVFEIRLAFQKVVCTTGEEAARTFFEPDRFTRRGSMPKTALKLLQDEGSVQMQDGMAHRHRKRMMMSIMPPDAASHLAEAVAEEIEKALPQWIADEELVLLPAAEEVLYRAVARWAGIPDEQHVEDRVAELHAMIDGAGSIGPRNWRGHILRARSERWARDLIRRVRSGEADAPEGSALAVIAGHHERGGKPLDDEVAAVELINVLRPTVAIAYFITFCALALHEHSSARSFLERKDEEALEAFVQEVRRYYPFFPFLAGRVREPFQWREYEFDRGLMVMLDLYGTNRDARIWEEPEEFSPERFLGWEGTPFTLIPQGGGDHFKNHRCAGEWITIEVMKAATKKLAHELTYEVPEQDLSVSLTRMPTFPKSRFVIRNVRTA